MDQSDNWENQTIHQSRAPMDDTEAGDQGALNMVIIMATLLSTQSLPFPNDLCPVASLLQ